MPTPNPLAPVKGAGTTLWVYTGKGDAYANPLSDDDWQRLAKVKDLTPGEMTAESYDDNYLDDEDADWSATGQGQKSAGDTSFTLAWKPGEEGQKGLIGWFESGDVRAYKIRFPNGTVDVFRGWISSIGIRKDRCSKCMRGCEMRGMVANFGGFLSINKLSQ